MNDFALLVLFRDHYEDICYIHESNSFFTGDNIISLHIIASKVRCVIESDIIVWKKRP